MLDGFPRTLPQAWALGTPHHGKKRGAYVLELPSNRFLGDYFYRKPELAPSLFSGFLRRTGVGTNLFLWVFKGSRNLRNTVAAFWVSKS